MTLDEIAGLCEGQVAGDRNKLITGVSTPEDALPGDLIFIRSIKNFRLLENSAAGAALVEKIPDIAWSGSYIIVSNPQLAFAKVARKYAPPTEGSHSIHPTAIIESKEGISNNVSIGPYCVIEHGAILGKDVVIGSGVKIGRDTHIGARTVVGENVVLKQGTEIGENCRLAPGVVIGADGFGLARDGEHWVSIPQLGRVVIGNDVEIGANTTIDRGAIKNTVIGDGVKLDNLIQIGHNVTIGRDTVIAAHTAIAGSTKIGRSCEIGGCVGIMDHSEVGDNIKIGGGSVVSGRLTEPGIYSSSLKVDKLAIWQKNAARIRKLDELARRLRKLEEK